jgi:hypothetical protein
MTALNLLRVSKSAPYIGVSTSTLAKMPLPGPQCREAERRIVFYNIKQADKCPAESTPRSANNMSGECA